MRIPMKVLDTIELHSDSPSESDDALLQFPGDKHTGLNVLKKVQFNSRVHEVAISKENSTASLPEVPGYLTYVKPLTYWNFIRGSLCVGGMIALWLSQIELVKALSVDLDYRKPFFQRAVNQSFLILCFPVAVVVRWVQKWKGLPVTMEESVAEYVEFSWIKLSFLATAFTFIYHFSGYFWLISIPITTVSTNSTLYQLSLLFSFLFSIKFSGEKRTRKKTLAVLLTLLGIFLVGLSPLEAPSSGPSNPLDTPIGVGLVLLSAFLYSVSQLFYGWTVSPMIRETSAFYVLMFCGFQGLSSLFIILPLGCFVWHTYGLEAFSFPSAESFSFISICSVFFVMYLLLMLLAIHWTNPSFVGIGCALVIPSSLITDGVLHGISPTILQGFGSVITTCGAIGYSYLLRLDFLPPADVLDAVHPPENAASI